MTALAVMSLLLTACGGGAQSNDISDSSNSAAGGSTTTTTMRSSPPTTIVGGPLPTLPISTTTTMRPTPTTIVVATTTTSTTTTTVKITTTTTTLPVGGNPTLGASALAYYTCGSKGSLKTSAINTASSGSTVLAWTGRGIGADINAADVPQSSITSNGAPVQIGSTQTYAPLWPDSAEALYAWTRYSGGNSNMFGFPVPHPDEFTGVIVEVLNGGNIASYSFKKVVSGANSSGTVTTTGPATLVAIWAGDYGGNTSDAKPDGGFTVIESQSRANCYVEVTVATKDVSAAGTYSVNWTPNTPQGAHLWLVAIQKK